MTAFTFRLDRDGYVCGGACDTSARSNEAWSMSAVPIVPLDPADIAWPNGERWAHPTETYGLLPETTHTKEAA